MIRYFLFAFLFIMPGNRCFAQETASSLAKKIETPLITSAGISMQFDLPGQGKVKIIVNNEGQQVRIETPTLLIISNGKTIWNYDKHADQVTIDNITVNKSPLAPPDQLFEFSKNYTSSIVSSSGNNYVLELTPNQKLADVLKSAGGMNKLELTVGVTEGKVKILKTRAMSAKGETAVSNLIIKPLSIKSVLKYDFNFKPKSSTKVVDLRE